MFYVGGPVPGVRPTLPRAAGLAGLGPRGRRFTGRRDTRRWSSRAALRLDAHGAPRPLLSTRFPRAGSCPPWREGPSPRPLKASSPMGPLSQSQGSSSLPISSDRHRDGWTRRGSRGGTRPVWGLVPRESRAAPAALDRPIEPPPSPPGRAPGPVSSLIWPSARVRPSGSPPQGGFPTDRPLPDRALAQRADEGREWSWGRDQAGEVRPFEWRRRRRRRRRGDPTRPGPRPSGPAGAPALRPAPGGARGLGPLRPEPAPVRAGGELWGRGVRAGSRCPSDLSPLASGVL